jgi:N-methylhydantoinase B
MTMTIRHERITYPPRGLMGGKPGDAGIDMINGERIAPKSRTTLVAGDKIVFQTPGGGGLFNPAERNTTLIKNDLESGLTTPTATKKNYNYD